MSTARKSRTQILREAKGIADDLKTSLRRGTDPADPEIEGLRLSLRDHYLSFLFAGKALSARASDVVNLMWLECSHTLIKRHRERIAKIDAEIERNGGHSRKQRAQAAKISNEGTTARRKSVHGLRAFLTQEEGFWSSLIRRFIETYGVTRARSAVLTLKICGLSGSTSETSVASPDVEHALPVVQVALVYYGDLARYTELYRESNNRERRFDRAAECYHQARLLVPSAGQPDHQLAVLASSRKDSLAAAFHYMRALAVRSSFVVARSNLETTYKQAVSQYRAHKDGEDVELSDTGQESVRSFIALLAFLVTDLHSPASASEIDTVRAKFDRSFAAALETRALSSESIVKIFLLAIATWWDARLSNDAIETVRKRNELALLDIVLGILVALFTVSSVMTEASLASAASAPAATHKTTSTLAARISAPVRRTAPALRIASLWLLGHLDHVNRAGKREAFWAAYAQVVDTFITAFPPELLPSLPSGCNLEEDFELLSFLPCPLPQGNAASPYVADHPNSEFFCRVQGFISDATLASGQSAQQLRSSIGMPHEHPLETDPRLNIALEDDTDILAEAMDASRLSAAYTADDDDDEDEVVLYNPGQTAVGGGGVRMPSPLAATFSAAEGAAPTAQDLLSSMLRGDSALGQQSIWAPSGDVWSSTDAAWHPTPPVHPVEDRWQYTHR